MTINIFIIIVIIFDIAANIFSIQVHRNMVKYKKIMLKLTTDNDNLKAENKSLIELLDEATLPRKDGEYFAALSDTSAQKLKYTCRSNSKEEKMRIKYQGTASMAPYQYYHKLKVQMPDWAQECYIKYKEKRQDNKRNLNNKL